MNFSYSPRAEADLFRIQDEVLAASGDREVTERYLTELMDRVEAKAQYPRSGTPLYWLDRFTGYYYVVFKAYIAFYYVVEDGIRIERVLHAKSDYVRRLAQRPRDDDAGN